MNKYSFLNHSVVELELEISKPLYIDLNEIQ